MAFHEGRKKRLRRTWLISLASLALQVSTSVAGALPAQEPTLDEIARQYTKRTAGGVHLPLVKSGASRLERRAGSSAIGLGDYLDVSYTVLMTIGGTTTPLILDTGSSDLWVMSDACAEGCTGAAPVYPQASFVYSGVDVSLLYGDSLTGTFAKGAVGHDAVGLAGLNMKDQFFGAINRTNTSVVEAGSAGIFGLGFPVNSVIWNNLFLAQKNQQQNREARAISSFDESTMSKPNIKLGTPFPDLHFRRQQFPSMPGLLGSSQHVPRQATPNILSAALTSYNTLGPFLPRLVSTGVLSQPMFSVTLQRDTMEVGGALGELSIGELPEGISTDKLTWVPLRLYTQAEGGLPAPSDSPNEVYPITWEVLIEGVYLDGQLLPDTTLSPPGIVLSALVDTGNSLIRGPSDVISFILSKLSANNDGQGQGFFSCAEPHTLAFKIGGVMFPVDPRDLATQAFSNNVQTCTANLVATDRPKVGGYQFGWSLGTPFLKGVLSSFYFGNITYPTHDPPKMGFLSTVPSDAGDRLKAVVAAAAKARVNLPAISEPAPSGRVMPTKTDSNGIPQAPDDDGLQTSAALRFSPFVPPDAWTSASLSAIFLGITLSSMWTWI